MSQADKLLEVLSDGEPHRTDEILDKVYGGEHLGLARIGARVHDLKNRGQKIEGWTDPDHKTLYWYQLENPAKSREAISANPARETSPGMEGALRAQGVLFGSEKKVRTPWDFT